MDRLNFSKIYYVFKIFNLRPVRKYPGNAEVSPTQKTRVFVVRNEDLLSG